MQKRLWRVWLALRFRLFQRHRYRQLVIEYVNGLPFVVLPEVFNPGLFPTGEFLAEHYTQIPHEAHVLDMGTGSGVGAIFAAQRSPYVTAADINPAAVRCVQINALLNNLQERITACHSDLFSALEGQRFDVVLFNPPFFRGTPKDAEDQAWRGVDVLERFAAALPRHLTANGYALVVFSSDGDTAGLLQACAAHQLKVEILAQRDMISEMLTVYRISYPHP
jgi:release factor glutamine methyltransferase